MAGRFDEGLVFRGIVRNGIVERRLDAERRVAKRRQVGFLRQVARREELDAGVLQAVFIVGLDEAERRRAGRQEGEDALRAGILDALHDRAEVVGRQRHADRLDDLLRPPSRSRP